MYRVGLGWGEPSSRTQPPTRTQVTKRRAWKGGRTPATATATSPVPVPARRAVCATTAAISAATMRWRSATGAAATAPRRWTGAPLSGAWWGCCGRRRRATSARTWRACAASRCAGGRLPCTCVCVLHWQASTGPVWQPTSTSPVTSLHYGQQGPPASPHPHPHPPTAAGAGGAEEEGGYLASAQVAAAMVHHSMARDGLCAGSSYDPCMTNRITADMCLIADSNGRERRSRKPALAATPRRRREERLAELLLPSRRATTADMMFT